MSFLRFYLFIAVFFIAPGCVSASGKLAYYSDYFSFIGGDAVGFVAFALDNNRGVDGADYQAEHFGVLYDEKSGWVKLVGMGKYENARGELERIPDSPRVTFNGRPEAGLVVTSDDNALSLEIDPVVIRLREKKGKRIQNWGIAKAFLNWNGRKIQGRVIYEQLIVGNWNRLTRAYAGRWDNFQGFYLLLGTGDIHTWQDLYLRSEGKGDTRRTAGFVNVNGWSGVIHATRFAAFDNVLNWGLYRWPQKWEIEIKRNSTDGPATGKLTLRQISRQNQRNWVIGGFAMSVVEGELRFNGKAMSVLGFVELIK